MKNKRLLDNIVIPERITYKKTELFRNIITVEYYIKLNNLLFSVIQDVCEEIIVVFSIKNQCTKTKKARYKRAFKYLQRNYESFSDKIVLTTSTAWVPSIVRYEQVPDFASC